MSARTSTPIFLLTGFLGSGKTTLLMRLLQTEALRKTAVVVNEFGEVALDHYLIRPLTDQPVTLIHGCPCCTIREDLSSTLREMWLRRRLDGEPHFDRVIIETTGLADPTPIINTLLSDKSLSPRYKLAGVLCTADSVNFLRQSEGHPEAAKQVALADRIVITKADLADRQLLAQVENTVRETNASAPILQSPGQSLDVGALMEPHPYGPERGGQLDQWLQGTGGHGQRDERTTAPSSGEGTRAHGKVSSFSLAWESPTDWNRLEACLQHLTTAFGDKLLRIKGLFCIAETNGPVVVHGVQCQLYPPVFLDTWPDPDKRSRIVFIVQDINCDLIEAAVTQYFPAAARVPLP